MARTRKSISTQNLIGYDVLIEETGLTSEYFKISQFNGYFYGGRNAFLVAGSGVLKPRSKVLVEILNSEGNTVFSAPVTEFSEGNSRLIKVEVYQDTPIGPGKIIILGSIDTYIDGTPIPPEWIGKYNVRWVTDVIISPRKENSTPIRFEKTPRLFVEEKFYSSPSESFFSQSVDVPVDISLQPKYYNTSHIGYLAKIESDDRYFSKYINGVITGSVQFSGSNGPETASIELPIKQIYNAKLAESDGVLIVTDFNNVITEAYISSSGQYTTTIQPLGDIGLTSSLSIQFSELNSQDTSSAVSFVNARLTDLNTLSGEINKARFSYKPANEPGEYKIIGEVKNEVAELFTDDFENKILETGKFRTIDLEAYWYAATMSIDSPESYYITSSLIPSGSVGFIEPCCNTLLDSINATPIANGQWITGSNGLNVPYFIGSREENSIELFPNSEYTLKFDAIATTRTGSLTLNQQDYSLDIYLVPTVGSSTRILNTGPLGLLIGTLTPETNFEKRNYIGTELNFNPSIESRGQFGVRFVINGGFWNIANVSVKTATEPFFSPDELNALLPVTDYLNKILEFKVEYLDINNNSINVSTTSTPTYFTGSEGVAGSSVNIFPYTGSAQISGTLFIQDSGSTIIDVQGSVGQLFTVQDSLSGSLLSVNDISGIPILNVSSDDTVKLGTYNAEGLIVTGSRADIKAYTLNHSALGSVTTTQTIDVASANYFSATSTGNTTWTFSNAPTSTKAVGFVLELTNGGSYTQTWPASVYWPQGTAPTLTATGVDVLTFITDDSGTIWRGVLSMVSSSAP